MAIQHLRMPGAVAVIHSICEIQNAFEAIILRQNYAGKLANVLIAAVQSVQQFCKPGIFNIPDQGHGADS
jgi:hypothetical protein